MSAITLRCARCGCTYSMERELFNLCFRCGGPLSIVYDYDSIGATISKGVWESRVDGLWKYFELLPCSRSGAVSLGEGNTLLVKCDKLGQLLGVKNLYVKDETKNPTGSFMDRGASVLVSKLVELNYDGVYGVFKGNLGASISAYCAKAGLKCTVFLSNGVDASKLYQMIAYGASIYPTKMLNTIKFDGKHYFADNADPLIIEGEKTIGFEVIEELNWTTPQYIIAPMGSGGLITALWKALNELKLINLISEINTKLVGVQSEHCAPIVDKFTSTSEAEVKHNDTIAIDIAFDKPSRGFEAVKALKESGGYAFKVSDEEMLWASSMLAKYEGIFAEPAAASTIACVKRMVNEGLIDKSDTIICIITGSGLKDPIVAIKELEKNMTLEKFIKHKVKIKPKLGIGNTKIQILKLLSEEKMHGYEVWKKMRKMGIEISIPAIYQHLKELEQMGLISRGKSEIVNGRTRTYYAITDKGIELLKILAK